MLTINDFHKKLTYLQNDKYALILSYPICLGN